MYESWEQTVLAELRRMLKEVEDGAHNHGSEECYREGYIDALVYILDLVDEFS